MKVQHQITEADMVQAPQDSIDRGPLLRDKKIVASGAQCRDEVRDRLALAGSRRPLNDQFLPARTALTT